VEALRSAVRPDCAAFFFSPLWSYAPAWKYQIDAMWAGLLSGVPTLNGYSGNAPPGWLLGDLHLRGGRSKPRLQAALDGWSLRHGLTSESICWVTVPGP